MTDQAILVTGAAGFIGFHVARQLLAEGRSVVGLDNLNGYYDPALKRARLAILQQNRAFSFVEVDLARASGAYGRTPGAVMGYRFWLLRPPQPGG